MGSIAKHRKRKAAFFAAAVAASAWMPTAWALPNEPAHFKDCVDIKVDGVEVSEGEKNISGKKMEVILNKARGAIDWGSFSIGNNENVNFSGPEGTKWMVLNRVVGDDATNILGTGVKGEGALTAAQGGTIFLVNPNGITFGPGASVDVGSLAVSTLWVSDDERKNFLGGSKEFHFHQVDKSKAGVITNLANITAADGYVAILAHTIENKGTIEAPEVALAAGKKITLSYDKNIDLTIDVLGDESAKNDKQARVEEGKVILNGAVVDTKNGYVLMSKETAANAVGKLLISDTSISNSGTIRVANSIKKDADGNIELSGDGGIITMTAAKILVDGELSAQGGTITTAGYDVLQVNDSANVHAVAKNSSAGTWNLVGKNLIVDKEIAAWDKSSVKESKVSNKALDYALANTNVNMTASPQKETYYSDIRVNAPIEKAASKDEDIPVRDTKLTLTAGRNIVVDENITSTEGKLNILLESDNHKDLQKTQSTRGDGANIIRADIETNGGDFETSRLHSSRDINGKPDLINGTYFGVKTLDEAGRNNKRHIYTKGGNIRLKGAEVLLATGGTVKLDTTSENGNGEVEIEGMVNSANFYDTIENKGDGLTGHPNTKNQISWKDARSAALKYYNGNSNAKGSHLAVITSALEEAIVSSTNPQDFSATHEAYIGGHVVKVQTEDGYGVDKDGTVLNKKNGYTVTETEVENDGNKTTVVRITDKEGNVIREGNKEDLYLAYVIDENGKAVTDGNGIPALDLDGDNVKPVINGATNVNGKHGGWYKLVDSSGKVSYARYWAWTEGEEKNNIFYIQTKGENIGGENFSVKDWGDTKETDHGHLVNGYYANFAPGEPNDDCGSNSSQPALAVNYDTHVDNNRGDILISQWDDMNDEIVDTPSKRIRNYVVEADLNKSALWIDAGNVAIGGEVGNLTKLMEMDIKSTGSVDLQGTKEIDRIKVKYPGAVNVVDNLTARAEGAISTPFVNAGGKIKLESGRDVALNGVLKSEAAGNNEAVEIIAQGNFLNEVKWQDKDGGCLSKQAIVVGDNSHWKVYSSSPATDNFGSGIGKGDTDGQDLNSNSFALWGWKAGFQYNAEGKYNAPENDPNNRYIFKDTPPLTFIVKPVADREAGGAPAESKGYPEGYTVTNSLSDKYTKVFTDGKKLESGENALIAREDVAKNIQKVMTWSEGFETKKKGTYPVTLQYGGSDFLKGTEIAVGYDNVIVPNKLVVTENGTSVPPVDPTPVTPAPTPEQPPVDPAPVTPAPTPEPVSVDPVVPVVPESVPAGPLAPETVVTPVPAPETSTVRQADPNLKPQLDALTTSKLSGSASIAEAQKAQGPSSERVLGLQTAELPFFNERGGKVEFYGTYDVSVDPDRVKMQPTAKVLPEPEQEKNQYRELETAIVTEDGTAVFKLTYNGSTLDIYPTDKASRALLLKGDGKKNVELESKALYEAFNHMGITLDDLDGVYTHFEKQA